MDKLKMHTSDLTDENIARIGELFPNCFTEAQDQKTGQVRRMIDFDLLRQELSDHIVEGPRERYHLDWPGKRESLLAANAPIAKTLRPCREESVNFDSTRNLFIEGDNLDALKLMQETYLNKVKVIYVDPPYNTGKDFIYDDDFADAAASVARDPAVTGRIGEQGGQDDSGGLPPAGAGDEFFISLVFDQRGVAASDDDVAVETGQMAAGLHDGVAGAQALGLIDANRTVADVRADRLALMSGDEINIFNAGLGQFGGQLR